MPFTTQISDAQISGNKIPYFARIMDEDQLTLPPIMRDMTFYENSVEVLYPWKAPAHSTLQTATVCLMEGEGPLLVAKDNATITRQLKQAGIVMFPVRAKIDGEVHEATINANAVQQVDAKPVWRFFRSNKVSLVRFPGGHMIEVEGQADALRNRMRDAKKSIPALKQA